MNTQLPPSTGIDGSAAAPPPMGVVPATDRKGIDLPVLKKGAKDFLDFLDGSKEIFYAYLYHRTGSEALAKTLLTDIYSDVLVRTMSFWWFGTLSMRLLLDRADTAIVRQSTNDADIDRVYVASLPWLSDPERKSVSILHDALWSLPLPSQRLMILGVLIGLSDEHIAGVLSMPVADSVTQIALAKDLLLQRWQPLAELSGQLGSLIFVPSLDLRSETQLRFTLVEKYSALRLRRTQWVIIGGLFAIMSNVIVASVLAFAVVTQPTTSLKGARMQVASLDAVLLRRQRERSDAKRSVVATFRESQRIAAYSVARNLTELGLASALEALTSEQEQEKEIDRLQKLLERARTALAPIIQIAFQNIGG